MPYNKAIVDDILVTQGCTTQSSWRAKKMLPTHLRAKLVKFFPFLFSINIKNQAKCM